MIRALDLAKLGTAGRSRTMFLAFMADYRPWVGMIMCFNGGERGKCSLVEKPCNRIRRDGIETWNKL